MERRISHIFKVYNYFLIIMYLNEMDLGKSVGIILIFLSVFFLLLAYGKDISIGR